MPRLVTTWFGVFLLERGKVQAKILFPNEPEELAVRMRAISEDKVLEEEKLISKGVKGLKVAEARLSSLGPVARSIKDREISSRPEVFGFSKSLLQKAMMLLGRSKIKEVEEDRYIIQAVRAIDDLNKTANLLSERLHEWYSLHYPELGKEIPDERYASIIAKLGDREQVAKEAGLGDPSSSVGAKLTDKDRVALMKYAQALDMIFRTKGSMESFIEDRMEKVAPNICHLCGPILGARLISISGGLERLARLPASTIQMLGAEKAFFKHLKEGKGMPKHGVIFQHPIIHSSPVWQRGKIARAFASKIAIAAKADSFSDKLLAHELKRDLDKRVADIKKRHPTPNRPKSVHGSNRRQRRLGSRKGPKGQKRRSQSTHR